jgi:hypothetical protein
MLQLDQLIRAYLCQANQKEHFTDHNTNFQHIGGMNIKLIHTCTN